MCKKFLATLALSLTTTLAHATPVAFGTIGNVSVGVGNIAVYLTATTGSPCPSGWFYSMTTDSDDQTINRLLAFLMTAWTTGTPVQVFGTTALCNQGTNSRFVAAQSQ